MNTHQILSKSQQNLLALLNQRKKLKAVGGKFKLKNVNRLI